MSLPTELRLLCHQLTSTPPSALPRAVPSLIRHVLKCRGPLATQANPTTKKDTSEASVLIHKLKTQISTLLQSRNVEQRYAATTLVKAVTDVAGWDILKGSDAWVRGLLLILGKPDPQATKSLAILSLTNIYLKIHQYQSLVREIATPTLPTYISACLNLLKSNGSPLLREYIFESFSLLVQQYPTVFRPSTKHIRLELRAYLAPTACDEVFVSSSLQMGAQRLSVLLYLTTAKNGSGEEWAKGVRELITKIHSTADQVYRAVIEEWEAPKGHVTKPVDMDEAVHGGSGSNDDLQEWTGIDAGVERVAGLLRLLAEHLSCETVLPITIPVGSILDMLNRLMSVVPPRQSKRGQEYGALRLHPAVDRNEREGLWAGLPRIHVAALDIYSFLAQRLGHGLNIVANACITQISWSFARTLNDSDFRKTAYDVLGELLPLGGSSLPKPVVDSLGPVIKGCCKDILPSLEAEQQSTTGIEAGKNKANQPTANADAFLTTKAQTAPAAASLVKSPVQQSAEALLPILLTYLPQSHLPAYLRATLDRTSILSHNGPAMLASVLNPFVGKNGKFAPSILPHLCRSGAEQQVVEGILRPRLPIVRTTHATSYEVSASEEKEEEDDVMDEVVADEHTADLSLLADMSSGIATNSAAQATADAAASSKADVLGFFNQAGATQEDNAITDTPTPASQPRLSHAPVHDMEDRESNEPAPKKAKLDTDTPAALMASEPAVAMDKNLTPNDGEAGDSDDDSDGSAHLVMEMSDDEDEDDL